MVLECVKNIHFATNPRIAIYCAWRQCVKMNINLFYVILLGGIPVLCSYYVLSQQSEAKQLWGGLSGWVFNAWLASMLLTVASYFYLAYMFVWGIDDAYVFEWSASEIEPWLCSLYVVFLGSASQFAYFSLMDIKNKKKSLYLLINLWTTAFASLLIAASAIAINGVSDVHNSLSIIAGFVLAFHHIFFDAIYWMTTFEPKYTQISN